MSKFSHNRSFPVARYAIRVAVIAGACFASAGARDAHTSFTVGATVRAVASMELNSMPQLLRVTAADVARGYSDAADTLQVSVHSNSQQGYALEFLSVAPIFSALTVQGMGADVDLGAEGGTVVQRGPAPKPAHLALKFRFMLAPGVTAGEYPWPLRLAIKPLEST